MTLDSKTNLLSTVRGKPWVSIALLGVLIVLLPLLAFLQYRWIGQVVTAERQRLQQSLDASVRRLKEDVQNQLARVSFTFRLGEWSDVERFESQISRFRDRWRATAPYAELIERIDVVPVTSEGEVATLTFEPETGELVEAELGEGITEWLRFVRGGRPEAGEYYPAEANGELRMVIPLVGAVVRRRSGRSGPRRPGPDPPLVGGIAIVDLDEEFISSVLIPDLVYAHFDPRDYAVGVFGPDREPIYVSQEGLLPADFLEPDARFDVFGSGGGRPGPEASAESSFPPPRGARRRHGGNPFGRRGDPRVLAAGMLVGGEWEFVVKHRAGSLEGAVTGLRNRNLAISFGTLLLLGLSGGMIVVWSERVRSLGRLQMEFAAGVSHELRTPLAVIRSAAYNIATGVVRKPEEVQEYAVMVQEKGRRLSEMVDQIILFAQIESGRRGYSLEPVSVRETVHRVLGTLATSIEESGSIVRTVIDPDLGPVLADRTGLAHAIQNLVSNAIKYGGSDGPAVITVQAIADPDSGKAMISVSDRGPGIDPSDLPHLFQPFYRGRGVGNTQGNGLGLNLVKRIVEGQNGRVTLTSPSVEGSAFTLHIPLVPPIVETINQEQKH